MSRNVVSFTNKYRTIAQLQFQDNFAMIDNIEEIKDSAVSE